MSFGLRDIPGFATATNLDVTWVPPAWSGVLSDHCERAGRRCVAIPRLLPDQPFRSFDEYVSAHDGGAGLDASRRMGPDETIEAISASGLRGRGGAGFPAGRKWASIRAGGAEAGDRYVVANGAEGEPGTFKDRTLMASNPYQVLEGLQIAAESDRRGARVRRREAILRAADRSARARGARDDRPRVCWVDPDQHRHRARRVPLRRGDRAARGGRRRRPAAARRCRRTSWVSSRRRHRSAGPPGPR